MSNDHDLEITISDGVLSQEVAEEAVLLDPEREFYFGLDDVGRAFWGLLKEHRRLSEIHRVLLQRYDVSPATLWSDLEDLARDLEAHALVKIQRTQDSRQGAAPESSTTGR